MYRKGQQRHRQETDGKQEKDGGVKVILWISILCFSPVDGILHGSAHADACSKRLQKCSNRVGDIDRGKTGIADAVSDEKSIDDGVDA